ncbi:MAG: tRNA pseudouridine(55) synthase TruB [Pseudomonadota bacterium]|nr:tRNA pseudouridine(55) synthase TruB [Pseudomonadota bacterium]
MARKRKGRPIHGWLNIDKASGPTSARVVAQVLKLTGAAKAGHGGTLDPMATGVLPIALGEATKTASYAMDGYKTYRFTLRWGEARDTDDAEGAVTETSDVRPTEDAVREALAAFTGVIDQVPPDYAAVKIDGRRAYDLARHGEAAKQAPRPVAIHRLEMMTVVDADHAVFEVDCGKGAYVRALARDLAEALGTVGHLSELRRTRAGNFFEGDAISLDKLDDLMHSAALSEHLRPVETALADIPALAMTNSQATRLSQGQVVQVLGTEPGLVRVTADDRLVALAEVHDGDVRPVRVFNL